MFHKMKLKTYNLKHTLKTYNWGILAYSQSFSTITTTQSQNILLPQKETPPFSHPWFLPPPAPGNLLLGFAHAGSPSSSSPVARPANFYSLLESQPFCNLFFDSNLPETLHPTQSELIIPSSVIARIRCLCLLAEP